MIKCDKMTEQNKNKVLQKLCDYFATSMREWANFSYVTFYEPSNALLEMVDYAKNSILGYNPKTTFPNSYILFEFTFDTHYDGLASLIVQDDFKSKFNLDVEGASLIFRNHFGNKQTCVVNNFLYLASGMPTGRDIWETAHDLATMRIMGKDYVKCNDKRRHNRAIALQNDLKEKGWDIDDVLGKLLNSKSNREALSYCFSYYFRYQFSNTPGYISPKK